MAVNKAKKWHIGDELNVIGLGLCEAGRRGRPSVAQAPMDGFTAGPIPITFNLSPILKLTYKLQDWRQTQ